MRIGREKTFQKAFRIEIYQAADNEEVRSRLRQRVRQRVRLFQNLINKFSINIVY